MRSDWLDADFVALIKRALCEQPASGQFYNCLGGDGYIFLTIRQCQARHKAQPERFETQPDVSDD